MRVQKKNELLKIPVTKIKFAGEAFKTNQQPIKIVKKLMPAQNQPQNNQVQTQRHNFDNLGICSPKNDASYSNRSAFIQDSFLDIFLSPRNEETAPGNNTPEHRGFNTSREEHNRTELTLLGPEEAE